MPDTPEPDKKPRRVRKDGQPDRRGAPPGTEGQPPLDPPSEREREMVKSMAGYGMRDQDIAHAMNIGETTLQRHFREELTVGRGQGIAKAVQTNFQLAVGTPKRDAAGQPIEGQFEREPSEKSLHLFLMNRAGFANQHQLSGPGGGAIPVDHTNAVLQALADNATPEELALLEKFFAGQIRQPDPDPD